MENSKGLNYLDIILYIFLAIGTITFLNRQLNTSKKKHFDIYPLTQIKLSFDTFINLGEIPLDKVVTFSGFLKNTGDKNLHISNLKASCGCTNFSIKDLLVKPSDSTLFTFTIKPLEEGESLVSIYFEANTKQKTYSLKVAYKAKEK